MTSEPLLMDLPKELFDNVIAHYVHSVHVYEASTTRGVSKTFDQAISYRIVNHLPATSFDKTYILLEKWIHGIDLFWNILADYLRSPVRKAMNDPLITFIHTCAELVLGIEGKSCDDEMKTPYVQDIIEYMTRGELYATGRQALNPDESGYMSLTSQELVNLTSAAAVGSLAAIKYLLEKNPESWLSHGYANWGMRKHLLSDPIRAAASNGHVEVMHHLLTRLGAFMKRESGFSLGFRQREYLEYQLQHILSLAIQSKHYQTIEAVVEFIQKQRSSFGYDDHLSSKEFGEVWIKYAVKTGCVKTLQSTMSAMMRISPAVYESLKDYHLGLAFLYSCEFGQVDLLRHLIAQGRNLLQEHGTYGIKFAAKYLHRNIITILLENGVSINDGRPIQKAIQYGNISIVKFMIARGAKVDEAT